MHHKPDIIFIVLDTQRADRFSYNDTHAPDTPHIDMFAKEAAIFKYAISPAQWTLPAHASMFTGFYPSQHTVQQLNSVLPDNIPTLAEHLTEVGYDTSLYSNNPLIGLMDNGITRGFTHINNFIHLGFNLWSSSPGQEHLSSTPFIRILRKIRDLLGKLLGVGREPSTSWFKNTFRFFVELGISLIGGTKYQNTRKTLDKAADNIIRLQNQGTPVFTFINLMGAHIPYDPPNWAMKKVLKNRILPLLHPVIRWRMNYYQQNPINWLDSSDLTSEMQQNLLAYYDAEVVAQDRLLGRFIQKLRIAGRFNETSIIIVSDHGDHLGEKKRVNHIFGAYEPLLHVPLIIRDSSQRFLKQGDIITNFVSTCQLYHTILTFAGIDTDGSSCLCSESYNEKTQATNPVYAEALPPDAFVKRLHRHYPLFSNDLVHQNTVYALYHKHLKLIYQKDKSDELYAVLTDPKEERNLISRKQNHHMHLKEILVNVINSMQPLYPDKFSDNPDSEVVKRLRDLGYVD